MDCDGCFHFVGQKTLIIVLAVLGSVLVIAVVGGVVACCVYKKRKCKKKDTKGECFYSTL